jgi:hypothetical protein
MLTRSVSFDDKRRLIDWKTTSRYSEKPKGRWRFVCG